MSLPLYITDSYEKQAIPTDGASVTPSDSAALANNGILFIGSGGTLVCNLISYISSNSPSSGGLTFTNIANGTLLFINVGQVCSTGTTCTGINVLY